MEKQAYWQEVIGALDNQLAKLKRPLKAAAIESAKIEQKACETWYKNELKSRGVDEDNILKLKQQIRELETKISCAEQRRSDVLRFDDWYQHTWLMRKPKLQTQLSDVGARYRKIDQQLKGENSGCEELAVNNRNRT